MSVLVVEIRNFLGKDPPRIAMETCIGITMIYAISVKNQFN